MPLPSTTLRQQPLSCALAAFMQAWSLDLPPEARSPPRARATAQEAEALFSQYLDQSSLDPDSHVELNEVNNRTPAALLQPGAQQGVQTGQRMQQAPHGWQAEQAQQGPQQHSVAQHKQADTVMDELRADEDSLSLS